jgi:hypothetical protein
MTRRYSPKASRMVEKEMRHRKHLKHGKMSRRQAIAIGLNKARRSGAQVPGR